MISIKGTWDLPSTTSIGALQSLAAAGSMRLVSDAPIKIGHERTLSLTSVNNNSGADFTFTGYDWYNNPITEVLAGPNANTVETASNFASISSITTNGAVSAVSVGTGTTGRIFIITSLRVDEFYAYLMIRVEGGGTDITYDVDRIGDPDVLYAEPDFVESVIAASQADTNTDLIEPCTAISIEVTASTSAGGLGFVYNQVGK